MIIVLKPGAKKEEADEILNKISKAGLKPLYMPGVERTVLGAIGDERVLSKLHLESYSVVERITPILSPYKLVSRELRPKSSIIKIGNINVGGDKFIVIGGPCAVESPEQMLETAKAVKEHGGHCLRGGAYKPRSSPYSFQGLEKKGLEILKEVSKKTGLPVVTEVVEVSDVKKVEKYASAFQVGARNMQNFKLLKAIGKSKKPVILKRGMAATVEELLMAGEYILAEGNQNVIFCERGIRTFETATRNTLDLNAIPYIKQHSHLPVIVDPSHGTGIREFVSPMSKAAIGCGADGIIVEVHNNPKEALSDGHQSLDPEEFKHLMEDIRPFVIASGRTL